MAVAVTELSSVVVVLISAGKAETSSERRESVVNL